MNDANPSVANFLVNQLKFWIKIKFLKPKKIRGTLQTISVTTLAKCILIVLTSRIWEKKFFLESLKKALKV